MYKKLFILISVLILSITWIFTGAAEAQLRPSSAVLLPYFEVDLANPGKTTVFAVGNVLNQPVDIHIEMRTNWGIPIFDLPVKLGPREVRSFNLRDWIVQGDAPGRTLKAAEKAHAKAALTGQKSPKDNLYYSTAVADGLAVGSIVIRTQPNEPPGALWGDFLLIDSSLRISMGDDLVNLERSAGCQAQVQSTQLCSHHALRFVSGKAFNLDTQVLVWTDRSAQPSKTPFPESLRVVLDGTAFNEAGTAMNDVHLRLLPLQVVSINSLGLKEPFGWIDIESEEPVFIGLHFDSLRTDGAALQTYCLPTPLLPPPDGPRIEIEKRTNGQDANAAPGPSIPVGSPVLWEYIVRNTGNTRLTQIDVADDRGVQVICPNDALNPGESMTCTGQGTAVACQYENLGTATARTPSGDDVTDDDPSHYFGSQNAKIDIEAAINGNDADNAPGLLIPQDSPTQWTYTVTNNGDVNLAEIKVTDEKGVVLSCPKTSLRPGESMACTASGTVGAGPYASVGAATAKPPCGPDVSDNDPVHYTGQDNPPGLKIEKRTNGQRYTQAPGASVAIGSAVTWSYIVTNTGAVALTNVIVTDDKVGPISCPKATLQPGESMTCTANGTATACQYSNTGTAMGTPPSGPSLTAQDWSFYFGQVHPAIDIDKRTNGQDAPVAPGLMINAGSPVQWTYIVKNTGDVVLTNVAVTDDKGVAVSCPKTTLQPGETMTCTANGTATSGQYRNVGTAAGSPPCGSAVSDSDASHYFGKDEKPGLTIEKRTNGQRYTQAPGANVAIGSTVTWSYIVKNTGNVTLTNVRVTDDKVSSISCPKTVLEAGESMTCTASGKAAACQYNNTGTALGTPPSGPDASAQDWSFYYGQIHPAIGIDKRTNGQDAPVAPGPMIDVGSPVQWTYTVTNSGDAALSNVTVTDDKGVAVSCPKTTLQPGESMTCTANGTAIAGQYRNVGSVAGTPPCGPAVSDSDPSHYYGKHDEPGLTIEKLTNGQHYTQAPGASVAPGSTVTWSYIVRNTGNVTLSNVRVTDDKVGSISCPKTTLQAGESMTCTASGKAAACQYSNTGTAVGTPPSGSDVSDQDLSYYFGQVHPAISIDKRTNGQDAPAAPGPAINVGSPVQWTYIVKNTGDVALNSVKVTDDKGVAVSCPKTTLQPGESMTCTGNGTATAGQYKNVGTATGTPAASCGSAVSDSDASYYYGKTQSYQGCTPGYWKNHTDSWPPTGYSPAQLVKSVFSQSSSYPSLGNSSLLASLSFQGGSTLEGAAGNLLRASTAALLNAAHPGVNYPRSVASILSDVNAAIASNSRDTMLALASALDDDNNRGCPLN